MTGGKINDSIKETLDSVLRQTYTNWELIIINDGSIDDSENIIKSYIEKNNCSDKIKYNYQNNQDQLNAILNGIKYISGDYVYILHSDDLLPTDDFFEKLNSVILEDSTIDAFIGDLIIIDKNSIQTGIQKVDYYSNKESVLPTLMLWLGRNLYADFMLAKKEVFVSSIKDSYLTWNMPFWICMDNGYKMLNIKNLEFPILKYRVHENNYINNDIGKLNVINGELRTLTRLMEFYNIPMYKTQFYIYRMFNKLNLISKFSPIYFNREEKNKGSIVEFVIQKRFGNEYHKNILLNALVRFYKTNNDRKIYIDSIDKNEFIYQGKDMRLFNNRLLNNELSELYLYIINEMGSGFNEIIVSNEYDIDKVIDITKFLCIYPYVKISLKNNI